ncbi:SDR family NAD(P)-dependent oxidoreductase [Sediminitomix flava]|uniref:NAD(P)-dependent dehydrogenase (Short-subunit alcohol dehydrogenase family) n=1 Tax=Sediminitomix flava TaxID=379075 RepID=A0A315Z172_SEDFL|nr:SDR family oxidoreductase [Sediminitomix flava]PWJ36164.1 NAD(P)-dependent dehydrogenase (short-subunit alcohol dehydrogenase family) [Sediminitomix flava]
MNSIENKRILLTGATSGIGRSLAKQLLEKGAKLAICGRSSEKMESLLQEVEAYSSQVYSETFSVTDEDANLQFIEAADNFLGGIDILINCAGLNSARGTLNEIKTEELDFMMSVNFRAPFIFMKEVFNRMQSKEIKGTIVNILSTVCLFSNENIGAYTASKVALDGLTKVFRKEARRKGVNVLSVYPGGVDTAFRTADRPDYMSADSVAQAIITTFQYPKDVMPHELVLRPEVEENF